MFVTSVIYLVLYIYIFISNINIGLYLISFQTIETLELVSLKIPYDYRLHMLKSLPLSAVNMLVLGCVILLAKSGKHN